MTNSPTVSQILSLAKTVGVAHNGGAGGQYILVATAEQLEGLAAALIRDECADGDKTEALA